MHRLVLILLLASAAFAQTVESVSAAPTAPAELVAAVSDHALKFTAAGNSIQLWPAKSIAGKGNGAESALYADIPLGAFAGIVEFKSAAQDFRGQKIPAGSYSLRYEQIPADGNHLGVAPSPDFFLLVPVASDSQPAVAVPYAKLVKLSMAASKTPHPAVFSLTTAAKKSPSLDADDQGHTAVTFDLNVNGKNLPVAMIVTGTAEQ